MALGRRGNLLHLATAGIPGVPPKAGCQIAEDFADKWMKVE